LESSAQDAPEWTPGRNGLDPARMAAWRAFIEAHTLILTRLTRELQDEQGLPLAWYDVLVQLSEAREQRLRMLDLASRVLLSQSGLTRLVDRMEHAGLVARVRCVEDGRGLFAELTPEGLATLRRTYPTHLRGVREWFADSLTDEDAAVLARTLERLAADARPSAGSQQSDPADG